MAKKCVALLELILAVLLLGRTFGENRTATMNKEIIRMIKLRSWV
jgi:hypothetical protein